MRPQSSLADQHKQKMAKNPSALGNQSNNSAFALKKNSVQNTYAIQNILQATQSKSRASGMNIARQESALQLRQTANKKKLALMNTSKQVRQSTDGVVRPSIVNSVATTSTNQIGQNV